MQQRSAHARVEVIARRDAVVPGTDLPLGIHFVLDPGWHIYWVNPGDSGQPPVLDWQLPPGFNAGEIEWPRPERLQSTVQLADYGYRGEVLLPVNIRVPASVTIGDEAPIAVDAKWLICREVCIPEHARLHLELPVAQQSRPNSGAAALFDKTEKLLPQPMPGKWITEARSQGDNFVLFLRTGARVTKAEFFPLEANQIDNAAPQKLLPLPTGMKLALKKSDLLTKPIYVLRGVLVLGEGASFRIEAAVRQPIK